MVERADPWEPVDRHDQVNQVNQGNQGNRNRWSRWSRWHGELADLLGQLPGCGGGLVTVGQRGMPHALLCHVGRHLAVAEATGYWSLRSDPRLAQTGVPEAARMSGLGPTSGEIERLERLGRLVHLLRRGWLPPGEESPRWVKRWLLEETAGPVLASELLAVVRDVHRADPDRLVVRAGPCDQPACVVHSAWSYDDWGWRTG